MSDPHARTLVLIQFTLFGVLLAALILFEPESGTLVRIAGIINALCGMGIGLRAILEHQMRNRSLPRISPEPSRSAPLVVSGLYRWMRHPIYSGVLLSAFGAAIAHGSLAAVGIAFVFLPFFYYKSSYEELLLRKIYPQYPAYAERVGRFIPRLDALKLFHFGTGDQK